MKNKIVLKLIVDETTENYGKMESIYDELKKRDDFQIDGDFKSAPLICLMNEMCLTVENLKCEQ